MKTNCLGIMVILFFIFTLIGGCAKSANKAAANQTQDLVNAQMALQRLDASYCDAIKDARAKDDCYYDVATSKLDASICTNIHDDNHRGKCVSEITD